MGLQWDDIDFATNTIHVRHSLSYTKKGGYLLKEPKTKNSIRKVAPPAKLMDELKKHIFMKKTDRMEAKELWQEGKYSFFFLLTWANHFIWMRLTDGGHASCLVQSLRKSAFTICGIRLPLT